MYIPHAACAALPEWPAPHPFVLSWVGTVQSWLGGSGRGGSGNGVLDAILSRMGLTGDGPSWLGATAEAGRGSGVRYHGTTAGTAGSGYFTRGRVWV